jgi:alpha-N-arabinofuranosidase
VPLVDAVATHDPETGETAVFLVNRSLDEEVSLEIDTSILDGVTVRSFRTLSDEDIHAVNTLSTPDRVGLHDNDSTRTTEGAVTVTLPPVSWSALTLA